MAPVEITQAQDILNSKLDKLHLASAKPVSELKQPDIEHNPDEVKWRARTARRLAEDPSLPNTLLPAGFPEVLESPLVWEGKDWTDESQWTYQLSKGELEEIDAALKYFRALKVPLGRVNQETFPLPTLGPVLKDLSRELHTGRGFFVVRTLPVDSYSPEDMIVIYAGISSYVGEQRGVQDKNTNVLVHIKDLSEVLPANAIGAPAYTTDKQAFHTDLGNIISLFALETAAAGGVSKISSSWRVYNELVKTRPDLIKTLSEPWTLDTFGGEPPFRFRPLLYWEDNKIIIQYSRRVFTGFMGLPRSTNIAPITEAQAEALDTIHFLAEKYNLGLNFQKGDIQYINNLSIFHARDSFTDTAEKKRHLLRLWLRNAELAWRIPKPLEETWKGLFHTTSEDDQKFPLEPPTRPASKGREADGPKYH